VAMVPVYARDYIKRSVPVGFGWLNAAIDLGAIIIVIILTISPMKKSTGKKNYCFRVCGFGCCIILRIIEMVRTVLYGIADSWYAGWDQCCGERYRYALKTPDNMRGPGKQCEFDVHQFKQ